MSKRRVYWMRRCLTFCLGTFFSLGSDAETVKTNSTASLWMESAGPVPALRVPATKAEWDRQKTAIRAELWKLLGKLPDGPRELKIETLSTEQRDGYRVEKFRLDNGAGASVPGYFLLPNGAKKSPAILYCHWHGGEYEIGKEEIFRSAHTPEIPAEALTKRGYAVMTIDAYCFGERNGQGPGGPSEKGSAGEMTASKFNLWVERSLWGMILRDDLIALDYLCRRPEIDPERIGVTGISMGATRTWWLMALDDRLKAGVAVACLTRYQDLIATEGLRYHGIYYFVPGMLNHFDTEAVVACVAPRPLLCMNGDQDGGSPVEGIRKTEGAVRPVYNLCGAGQNFESLIYPNIGHVYLPEMWQRMLEWMDRNVRGNDAK
jgi:dipeptidyl aminopeptidase/acylaminoacyl peptidase